MEVIYLKEGEQFYQSKPIVGAIGFFDGLHLGHMALVHEVERVAKEKNYCKALITFLF